MKEILGKDLKHFFNIVDKPQKEAKVTYDGNQYEVWEISDELFTKMCDITEEQLVELAGEDAWWRSSDGSVLDSSKIIDFNVNKKQLRGWGTLNYKTKQDVEYKSLTDYLCNCIGVSLPKNICACAMDLAKFNDMTMGKLFSIYEQ